MRKFRKSICAFLSVVMLLTCLLLPSSAQLICDSLLQPTPTDASLYISTEACPDAYTDYVNQNVHRFLGSIPAAKLTPGDTLTVGTPFAFSNEGSDIYYFPILRGSEILYTLRVFPVGNGEYNGILGRSFVDELNELAASTSLTTPLMLVMEGNTVVAYVGNDRSVIFTYPAGLVAEADATLSTAARTVVNASEVCAEVSCSYTVPSADTMGVVLPNMHHLEIDLDFEVQGNDHWCSAYVAAAIIRYLYRPTDMTAAIDIMRQIEGSALNIYSSLTLNQVANYANTRNIDPTVLEDTLTIQQLKNELLNDRPVFFVLSRPLDESGLEHSLYATCLYGFHEDFQTWLFWNPWYPEGEVMPWGGTYVVGSGTNQRVYTYAQTIYHWQIGE